MSLQFWSNHIDSMYISKEYHFICHHFEHNSISQIRSIYIIHDSEWSIGLKITCNLLSTFHPKWNIQMVIQNSLESSPISLKLMVVLFLINIACNLEFHKAKLLNYERLLSIYLADIFLLHPLNLEYSIILHLNIQSMKVMKMVLRIYQILQFISTNLYHKLSL